MCISLPHTLTAIGANTLLESVFSNKPGCQDVFLMNYSLLPHPILLAADIRAVLALAVIPGCSMILNRCPVLGRLNGVLLETRSWLALAQCRAQGRTPPLLGRSGLLWGWSWESYMCSIPGLAAWLLFYCIILLLSNKQCIKGPVSTPPWRDLSTENTTSPHVATPNEHISRNRKVLFKIWTWEPSARRVLQTQGSSEFDTMCGELYLQSETHRLYCRDGLMGTAWHLPYMGITWQSLDSNWLALLLWLGEWPAVMIDWRSAVMIGWMASCYDWLEGLLLLAEGLLWLAGILPL